MSNTSEQIDDTRNLVAHFTALTPDAQAVVQEAARAGVGRYVALITQESGPLDPTVIVLENSLPETPSISLLADGIFGISVVDAIFKPNKTVVRIGATKFCVSYTNWNSETFMRFVTYDMTLGVEANGMLDNTPLEILVYP